MKDHTQDMVSQENLWLIRARMAAFSSEFRSKHPYIAGRWYDVVPSFYHRHYTDCLLRKRGALLHYIGPNDTRPDPQIYS